MYIFLYKIKEENLLIVTEEEFKEYCVQNPTSDYYPTLVYLKAIGQILWFNHIPKLEKYIFPNPEAISEMIFSVLENKKMDIKILLIIIIFMLTNIQNISIKTLSTRIIIIT